MKYSTLLVSASIDFNIKYHNFKFHVNEQIYRIDNDSLCEHCSNELLFSVDLLIELFLNAFNQIVNVVMQTASQFRNKLCELVPCLCWIPGNVQSHWKLLFVDEIFKMPIQLVMSVCAWVWARARKCVCLLLINTHRLIFRQLNLITVYFVKLYIRMLGKDLISCLQLTICFYAFANISICIFDGKSATARAKRWILCSKRWFGVGSLILSATTFWIIYMISCGSHTKTRAREGTEIPWLFSLPSLSLFVCWQ